MHGTRRTVAVLLIAGAMATACDTGAAPPSSAATSAPPPAGTPIAVTATASPARTTATSTQAPVATPAPTPSANPGTLPPPNDPPLASVCNVDAAAPSATAASITSFRWTHKRKLPHRWVDGGGRLAPTSGGWVYWDQDDLDFSPDLVNWLGMELDGFTVNDELWLDHFATAAGGTVAFGEILREDPQTLDYVDRPARIASADGRRWVDITDVAITSATIYSVGSTGCDLIVMGTKADGTPAVWASTDGLAWTASTDPDVAQIGTRTLAYATGPGRVLAFAADPPESGARVRRIEVWGSSDGLTWDRLGSLPGSARRTVWEAAYGNGRWLVLGSARRSREYTWTSVDGTTWERTRHKHPIGIEQVAGYTLGFIATGTYGDAPGDTCGSGAPYIGRTWVSEDGAAWTEVSRSRGVAMLAIAALDGRLYGLGNSTKDSHGRLWWGPLPGVASTYGPATLGPLPPGTGGCGP